MTGDEWGKLQFKHHLPICPSPFSLRSTCQSFEPALTFAFVLCTVRNPFRQRRSIQDFCSLFLLSNQEIANRKSARFSSFLKKVAGGTLFARPKVKPPYVAHIEYHPPMPYVLQSSYEDVETELNVLRQRHLDKLILFVGGDGLTINRINWWSFVTPRAKLHGTP